MSFAYKKLQPSDFSSTPYVANKLYDIPSSSYDDLVIKIYVGEYVPIQNLDFDPVNDNRDIDGNYRRLIFDSVVHLYYSNYVTESSPKYLILLIIINFGIHLLMIITLKLL